MDLLDTTELYSRLKNYLQELIHPIYFKLTWDDAPSDSWLEKFYLTILVDFFKNFLFQKLIFRILRTRIVSLACSIELSDCIKKSQKLYKNWMNGNSDE